MFLSFHLFSLKIVTQPYELELEFYSVFYTDDCITQLAAEFNH